MDAPLSVIKSQFLHVEDNIRFGLFLNHLHLFLHSTLHGSAIVGYEVFSFLAEKSKVIPTD